MKNKQDPRNVLFDVFINPDSQAALAVGELEDRSSVVVEGTQGKSLSLRTVTKLTAMRLVGEKLRKGFCRAKSTMYFDPNEMKFTCVHPDLSWGGRSWLLAARPPTVKEGVEAVVAQMRRVSGKVILPVEIDAWASRQEINAAYIVAFTDLPVWSLVLAETSLSKGWLVRANSHLPSAPSLLPSMNPLDWDSWLKEEFDLKLVQRTRVELGFTLDSIHKPDRVELIESENWSALI